MHPRLRTEMIATPFHEDGQDIRLNVLIAQPALWHPLVDAYLTSLHAQL